MKPFLTTNELNKANAILVGKTNKTTLTAVGENSLTAPGYYFITQAKTKTVLARFYVGRTKRQEGFKATFRNLRAKRSITGVLAMQVDLDVYYVHAKDMKHLTTAFGKSKLGSMFTKCHSGEYNSLQEVNRMLSEGFVFQWQRY